MIRIAVRCPNWVGDTVMATPVLAHLRASYPGAEITAVARPNSRAVLEGNPHVDRVWIADDRRLGNLWRLARRVRRERFDLAILLPNSFRSALPFYLAGVRKRVGYARDRRSVLLTHPVECAEFHIRCHQVEYYMNLLADLGACNVEEAERQLVLHPTDAHRREIDNVLAGQGLSANRFLAAISPGAAYGSSKCWLPDRFARVADFLTEKHGAAVLLVGAPDEAPLCHEIASLCRRPVFDLGPRVSLGGLVALCERLGLFVTNDCGAMHVAAAMRVPLVAIFGPTDPTRTLPYDPDASVVEKIKTCRCEIAPCYKKKCPIDHRCMTAVETADVEAAIERQIQRLRARS
ncbi:MAG: lipopolysaccharide heptosyltransferase II [Candidatus Sumerlaeota bacterium]|nr:lipopolysaccharide heptosyltransferase II [Candidatus Sumerlaeota bacterium]